MINLYGFSKWKEQKTLMTQHSLDLLERQKTSMAFLQAQNDIRQDILMRRRDLVLRKIFTDKEYEQFMNLHQPFKKCKVKTFYNER